MIELLFMLACLLALCVMIAYIPDSWMDIFQPATTEILNVREKQNERIR